MFAPGSLITGANAFGGTTTMRGTSQAVPFVTGAAVLAQHAAQQELGRRLTIDEFRRLLRETGTSILDGDDEDDNVKNTGLAFARLDVPALLAAVGDVEPGAVDPDALAHVRGGHSDRFLERPAAGVQHRPGPRSGSR